MTDHAVDIARLREGAIHAGSLHVMLSKDLAADLLEMHDKTSISLDNWGAARRFVENLVEHPIEENHV